MVPSVMLALREIFWMALVRTAIVVEKRLLPLRYPSNRSFGNWRSRQLRRSYCGERKNA
jgi:hypothetical protein